MSEPTSMLFEAAMDGTPLDIPSPPGPAFGARLRAAREAANLTQEELAARAGLSTNAISALERGERRFPYPSTIRALADALGLTASEHASLAAAVPRRVGRASPARGPLAAVHRLPHPRSPLVGRSREVAAARALLIDEAVPLVTLTGTGGVGKTSLALEIARSVADSFADGVAFVDLAPVRDPDLVLAAIAQALVLGATADRLTTETLIEVLRPRVTLLVLDNCEQVVAAAPLIALLLDGCPGLRVLATSRAPLRIRGEHLRPTLPLAVPDKPGANDPDELGRVDSVALFVARARAANPDFALTSENAAVVAGICRRLDGLPLAIELAAARLRVLPLSTLAGMLTERLGLLIDGERDAPDRQRTMRSAIAWSYGLLAPAEAWVFRRLAVFDGAIPLEGAAAVSGVGSSADVEPFLLALVDQSLVQLDARSDDEPWYRMLETLRAFGLAELQSSGEEQEIRDGHALFVASIATRLDATIQPVGIWAPGRQMALDRAEAILPEIRSVIGWFLDRGEHERALTMVVAFRTLWWHRNRIAEGRVYTERILAVAPPRVDLAHYQALIWAGLMAADQGDSTAANYHVRRGLDLAQALGDPNLLAEALRFSGIVSGSQDDDVAALAFHRRAAALESNQAAPGGGPLSLCEIGSTLVRLGRLDEGERVLIEAVAAARPVGSHVALALSLIGLGTVARFRGRLAEARAHVIEAIGIGEEARNLSVQAEGLVECAGIAVAVGDAALAARWLGTADTGQERAGRGRYHNHRQYLELVSTVRQVLGVPGFDDEWSLGATLPIPGAITEVADLDLSSAATNRAVPPHGLSSRE